MSTSTYVVGGLLVAGAAAGAWWWFKVRPAGGGIGENATAGRSAAPEAPLAEQKRRAVPGQSLIKQKPQHSASAKQQIIASASTIAKAKLQAYMLRGAAAAKA